MPTVYKALFSVPFPDFDYESLAKDCGCTAALHCREHLIVRGSFEAVRTLEQNLDFSCLHMEATS